MNEKLKKINLFHFGDCGSLDELNPFSIFSKENASEVLTLIAYSEPYTLNSNELWHQVFGNINEYLVTIGFFEKPVYLAGEGRFFQSLHIE